MSQRQSHASDSADAGVFQTTHWSLVLRAGQREDRDADAALAVLCQRYWFPLYAYVRRHVADAHEAQDLTQEFFARLLEKHYLASADPQRGKFRCFLLTTLKHFLTNEWKRDHAQKRGGALRLARLDFEAGESRLSLQPVDEMTPERIFERQWVLTLLDLVMRRLETEYRSSGRGDQFERLKDAVTGQPDRLPYAVLGANLGISEEAARQAAGRLRKRYRELLREEVLQTVAGSGDVDDEIRSLFELLGK
jgi:RNA polymerase sigma factor (sigma-70 family)